MKLYLIVAACEGMGIGINGGLPWRLKEEVKYFARMTKTVQDPKKKNAVIMGRKTWESIPEKFRPLKDRLNVVLSRQTAFSLNNPNTIVCASLPVSNQSYVIIDSNLVSIDNLLLFQDALKHLAQKEDELETLWLIGGHSLYSEAMEKRLVDRIYLTEIQGRFECDTFFPEINTNDYGTITDDQVPNTPQREGDVGYVYKVLQRRRSELWFIQIISKNDNHQNHDHHDPPQVSPILRLDRHSLVHLNGQGQKVNDW